MKDSTSSILQCGRSPRRPRDRARSRFAIRFCRAAAWKAAAAPLELVDLLKAAAGRSAGRQAELRPVGGHVDFGVRRVVRVDDRDRPGRHLRTGRARPRRRPAAGMPGCQATAPRLGSWPRPPRRRARRSASFLAGEAIGRTGRQQMRMHALAGLAYDEKLGEARGVAGLGDPTGAARHDRGGIGQARGRVGDACLALRKGVGARGCCHEERGDQGGGDCADQEAGVESCCRGHRHRSVLGPGIPTSLSAG